MSNAVLVEDSLPVRKLSHFFDLREVELRLINQWAARARAVAPGVDLMVEGGPCDVVMVVQDGWLIRHRELADGRRQVVNFLLPGDVFDIGTLLFNAADQTLTTVTAARVTELTPVEVLELFDHHPRLAVALTWSGAQEAAIFSEHLVNIGRRTALERLAHIILELHRRLRAVGLASGAAFELPVSQVMLGDALGLTSVHVSRTLRRLRETGAVRLDGQHLTITDAARLKAIAGFSKDFLHLAGAPDIIRRTLD